MRKSKQTVAKQSKTNFNKIQTKTMIIPQLYNQKMLEKMSYDR